VAIGAGDGAGEVATALDRVGGFGSIRRFYLATVGSLAELIGHSVADLTAGSAEVVGPRPPQRGVRLRLEPLLLAGSLINRSIYTYGYGV
jgi:hypothetical protein